MYDSEYVWQENWIDEGSIRKNTPITLYLDIS